MKPTFLIIGSAKCGTTTLWHLLNQHPDVFLTNPKEPNFFCWDAVYAKGWPWYESLFSPAGEARARGEASVWYSSFEHEDVVCSRVKEHLPAAKLIYIVRHPMARLESGFRQLHDTAHQRDVFPPYSFTEALKVLPELIVNTNYWERINKFREHFGDDQILVLFLEELKSDPRPVLANCFQFLGVDPTVEVGASNARLNPLGDKHYDTRLLRFIRTNKVLGPLWKRMPKRYERVLRPYVRRRFTSRITWDFEAKELVRECLDSDLRRFLTLYGRPESLWRY